MDSSIFKAYDIRGTYPDQLNEQAMFDIIQAYSAFVKPKRVALGRDVRLSSPSLAASARDSFRAAGVDVVDIGVVGADMLYFAAWNMPVDGGVYVSASHNPGEWNGLKLSRKGAVPISSESGLKEIAALAQKGARVHARRKGAVKRANILDAYVRFVLSFVNSRVFAPKKIVANANFGAALAVWNRIVEKGKLPIKTIPLNAEPDGSFPKGAPNPLLPENRRETTRLVKKHKADLGVAWDADADRCFFVDEKGNFVEGYFITALLARELLKTHAGEKIIIDPRLTWATTEAITKAGGIAVISPAGGTLIAERMRKENALFAGEMSSHFYFRANANRDNGMIPLLLALQMMSVKKKKLSELVAPFIKKYFISGEINFKVRDPASLLRKAEEKYGAPRASPWYLALRSSPAGLARGAESRPRKPHSSAGKPVVFWGVDKKGRIEHIDGLSVAFLKWRFNLRSSNTEPLVRLNVEARSAVLARTKTKELSLFIKTISKIPKSSS